MRFVLLCAFAALASPAFAADKFKAVTTFTVIADMARNVAGDVAEVESITKPGAEIHNYAPTPRDIVKAQDADLILWNGLNLELWFEQFFRNLSDVPSAVVSDGVEPMSITQGPYNGKPNPHAWMSVEAAQVYVDNIVAAFAEHDPDNAQTYRDNGEAYKARILAELGPLKEALAAVPEEDRWLVTSEGAFSYLATSRWCSPNPLSRLTLPCKSPARPARPMAARFMSTASARRTARCPPIWTSCARRLASSRKD